MMTEIKMEMEPNKDGQQVSKNVVDADSVESEILVSSPEDAYVWGEKRHAVWVMVSKLRPTVQEVLMRRLGFYGPIQDSETIAKELKMSVRQVETEEKTGLSALRHLAQTEPFSELLRP